MQAALVGDSCHVHSRTLKKTQSYPKISTRMWLPEKKRKFTQDSLVYIVDPWYQKRWEMKEVKNTGVLSAILRAEWRLVKAQRDPNLELDHEREKRIRKRKGKKEKIKEREKRESKR